MSKLDDFCIPIPGGLTAVPDAGALSAVGHAQLLERLRQFERARQRACVEIRAYPVRTACNPNPSNQHHLHQERPA